MAPERRRNSSLLAAMFGLALADPECLLFDYAMATSKGDKDSPEIVQFLKEEAEKLGITEEQFQKALEAMEKTSEILDEASKTE